jgi:hypothetical protein
VRRGAAFVKPTISAAIPVTPDIAWYDPSDNTKITIVTGSVTALADKTAHGYNLALTGVCGVGTIGGKQSLAFGAGMLTSGAIATVAQPITKFWVLQPSAATITAAATTSPVFAGLSGPGSGTAGMYIGQTTKFYTGYAGAVFTSSGVADTNPHLLTYVANGASSVIYLDGVSVASGDGGTRAFDGTSVIRLGADTGLTLPYLGGMGEVAYYTGAMSAPNIALMKTYFTAKWGTP